MGVAQEYSCDEAFVVVGFFRGPGLPSVRMWIERVRQSPSSQRVGGLSPSSILARDIIRRGLRAVATGVFTGPITSNF